MLLTLLMPETDTKHVLACSHLKEGAFGAAQRADSRALTGPTPAACLGRWHPPLLMLDGSTSKYAPDKKSNSC